jgi:arylsulfatase A-like enzyme
MARRASVAVALAACALMGAGFGRAAEGPPNIVLLLLDDQDAFTPFWDAMPNTAALVLNRGMSFSTAISPTPICTPGRCTLLSGRLAHNTGVFTIAGPYGPDAFAGPGGVGRTIATALSSMGYVAAHFGKTWGSEMIDPGWSYWCSLNEPNLYEGTGYTVVEQSAGGHPSRYVSGEYSTDFISDKANAFLAQQAGNPTPLFLFLCPTAPHLPLPPAPRHAAAARARWAGAMPERLNYNERDVSDKPAWLRSSAGVRSAAVPYANGEYYKRMGSLMAVDEMMARLAQTLAAQGKWWNTVVIVTSDNGYNLGSHRLIHKMAPYEESLRVPMVFAGPGVSHGQVGRIVGLHDVAPTLIQLAGGVPPGDIDGRSLVPFLRYGPAAPVAWRGALVTEYDGGWVHPGDNPGGSMSAGFNLDLPTYRSVRTDTRKYILWSGTGEEEVYDLASDPFELNNLVRTSPGQAQALMSGLRPLFQSLVNCSNGNCP